MTFEQRMAELGVDLSDLPKEYDDSHVYKYFVEAINFFTEKGKDPSTMSYPLYLVDIIDRMETRIVNLTLERDSLKECMKYMTYDEDGYLQDRLKIRCENCPFMIDGECRVREEDDDRTDN